MTFKELSAKLKTAVPTVANLIDVLSDSFNKIEGGGGGSSVSIDPLVDDGIPIANVTIDGNTDTIFTPIITTFHAYSADEHKVGVWYHDGISEDVYEQTIPLKKAGVNQYEMFNNRTFINSIPANYSYIQISGFYAMRDGWIDNMGIGTSTIVSIDIEHRGIYVETSLNYSDIIATFIYTKSAT